MSEIVENDFELFLVLVKLITGEEIIGVTPDPDMQDNILIIDNPYLIHTTHEVEEDEIDVSSYITLVRFMGSAFDNLIKIKEKNIMVITAPSTLAEEYYNKVINLEEYEDIGTVH